MDPKYLAFWRWEQTPQPLIIWRSVIGWLKNQQSGNSCIVEKQIVHIMYGPPWNQQLAPENGWLDEDPFLLG